MAQLIGTGADPRYPAGLPFDVPDAQQDFIDELLRLEHAIPPVADAPASDSHELILGADEAAALAPQSETIAVTAPAEHISPLGKATGRPEATEAVSDAEDAAEAPEAEAEPKAAAKPARKRARAKPKPKAGGKDAE